MAVRDEDYTGMKKFVMNLISTRVPYPADPPYRPVPGDPSTWRRQGGPGWWTERYLDLGRVHIPR